MRIITNPKLSAKEVEAFKKKIKDNKGYCPCAIPSEDTKCMCKEFREKTTTGECHCGLYCKVN